MRISELDELNYHLNRLSNQDIEDIATNMGHSAGNNLAEKRRRIKNTCVNDDDGLDLLKLKIKQCCGNETP